MVLMCHIVKMGEKEIAEATKLYESGLSLREIERKMGTCKSTLGRTLVKAGVELRPARRVSRKS
jgi:hypothetical protein